MSSRASGLIHRARLISDCSFVSQTPTKAARHGHGASASMVCLLTPQLMLAPYYTLYCLVRERDTCVSGLRIDVQCSGWEPNPVPADREFSALPMWLEYDAIAAYCIDLIQPSAPLSSISTQSPARGNTWLRQRKEGKQVGSAGEEGRGGWVVGGLSECMGKVCAQLLFGGFSQRNRVDTNFDRTGTRHA